MRTLDDDNTKIDVLRMSNDGFSSRKISATLGIAKSTINYFLARQTYKDWWASRKEKPIASGHYQDHHQHLKKIPGNRFIVTSAQNNTFVHSSFLSALKNMAEHLNAQIIVGTYSYNRSGFQNAEKGDGDWFDPAIVPYIVDEPAMLANELMWCGELNILPTAVNPLSGFQSYTKGNSGIIPHAKVQLESLPYHKGNTPRMLYTTGTVTQRNYIEKKAGQKASFHHIFGALLVEVDSDGDWFVRQLIADSSGGFQDLDTYYHADGITTNKTVEAINWGDIHVGSIDEGVIFGGFVDSDAMLNVLKPKYQFIHDVFDANARSHHHRNDHHKRFELHVRNRQSVESEIESVAKFLKMVERNGCDVIVVNSNHDRALKRWLNEADYRTDYVNARYFLELQLQVYRSIEQCRHQSILEWAVKRIMPELRTRFLDLDESFIICGDEHTGIQCGMHGDLGISGAKGSPNAFKQMGTRINIGHSHAAQIIDGVYQAGTCTKLDLGYNRGIKKWNVSQIVTYPNGKRAVVTFKGSKWRAK